MLLYCPKAFRTNWIYIMTNRRNGTLYTGSTSDIVSRVADHRLGRVKGFTSKYNLTRLVWFEMTDDMDIALLREKRIKKWNRQWKIDLIEASNPNWDDLFERAKESMASVIDY